jgi:uncharacterized UBP type Zn finger protein
MLQMIADIPLYHLSCQHMKLIENAKFKPKNLNKFCLYWNEIKALETKLRMTVDMPPYQFHCQQAK